MKSLQLFYDTQLKGDFYAQPYTEKSFQKIMHFVLHEKLVLKVLVQLCTNSLPN